MNARLPRTPKASARNPRRTRADGRVRAVIDRILPEVDCGRFPAKRIIGDTVVIEADVFGDGHDVLACMLGYRHEDEPEWHEVPMTLTVNDRWRADFKLDRLGRYRYTVSAWVDRFLSWRHDFKRRVDPADIAAAARVGGKLIAEAASRAPREDAARLREWAKQLGAATDTQDIQRVALDETLAALAESYPDRRFASVYERELKIVVDPPRARFSSWYELFPRSTSAQPGRHGTFRDVEARLPYVRELGFDVLYLPPIHPIGRIKRKGKNNALDAAPDDVGSPWAIGSDEGGHKTVHPELGPLEDFRHLVATARDMGIEVALDIAFQSAPDHPYVKAHPEWFTWRPDGTVQYAENPPKKYQDIYPFNFESEEWTALWEELKSVFEFWIDQGVRIFRVDNPHTKPFPFWEWAIQALKAAHPDLIFLSEAFTRPKIMHRLAKLGFTHSYTYFAWRNTKHELIEYFTELAHGPGRDYFRPECMAEYARHSDGLSAAQRQSRVSAPGFCWRRHLRQTMASTDRHSNCSSTCRASRAAKNIFTPRNTRSGRGTSNARRVCAT